METRAKRLAEVAFDTGDAMVTTEIYENIAEAPMTVSEVKQKIKEEELELKGSVPVVLNLSEEEISSLIEKQGAERKDCLTGIMARLNMDLWLEILTYECLKVSEAGKDSEDARKKYIDAPVSKAANGIKWKVDISQEKNEKDVWLAFIDAKDKRVIISVWNGTKLRLIV
jgi:hypothetical protein